MKKVFLSNKELVARLEECKKWKKLDLMSYAIEASDCVEYIKETYKLSEEDAKHVFESLMV